MKPLLFFALSAFLFSCKRANLPDTQLGNWLTALPGRLKDFWSWWSRRTAYPRAPRTGAVSFTIKGLSFLGSGFSGSTTFDDFEQFLPNVPFNPNTY